MTQLEIAAVWALSKLSVQKRMTRKAVRLRGDEKSPICRAPLNLATAKANLLVQLQGKLKASYTNCLEWMQLSVYFYAFSNICCSHYRTNLVFEDLRKMCDTAKHVSEMNHTNDNFPRRRIARADCATQNLLGT